MPIAIRDLATLADYRSCVELQEAIWGAGFSERVPVALLRVSQMLGGVAAGAFDGERRLVGFVFGLTGIRDGRLVHWSDMLAVLPSYRNQGLGRRLKEFQRAKVLTLGVKAMLWTYDPLVSANAHFNINVLGARPVEYVPDMYGSGTGSILHGDLPTDRLVVEWDLLHPAPVAAGRTMPSETSLPVLGSPDGADQVADGVPAVAIAIPADFVRLRLQNDLLARRWRLAVRAAFQRLLARGYRVTGFVQARNGMHPYYVLELLGAEGA
jgi:predicted GNAT superfamily acetyltransferase